MKKLALILTALLTISTSNATAATKTPTPKPTAKATATAKTTAKPTAKASAKPTTKPTTKPTATPTTSATTKPTVKPKPKPKPKKPARKTPSPKPKWPPAGFASESGVYAKIPSSKELIGILSAKTTLASQVEACTKFVCGAVLVASEVGCRWWEVNSRVFAQDKTAIGTLQTVANATKAKQVQTIILISPDPLESLEYISDIEVVCHQEQKPEGYPSVTFTKVAN